MAGAMAGHETCESCLGSGEIASHLGPLECPDCGGTGTLPPKSVLVEWRSRDIERALGSGVKIHPGDIRFLLAELAAARKALVEVVALAHDIEDEDGIGQRIRFTAQHALGLETKKE
jgi:hypothetical protein